MTEAIWNEMQSFMVSGWSFEFGWLTTANAFSVTARYVSKSNDKRFAVTRVNDLMHWSWEAIKSEIAKAVSDGTLHK